MRIKNCDYRELRERTAEARPCASSPISAATTFLSMMPYLRSWAETLRGRSRLRQRVNAETCKRHSVETFCIPQRGGCKTPERRAYEKSPSFKKGVKFRAGIEGRISVMLRGRGYALSPLGLADDNCDRSLFRDLNPGLNCTEFPTGSRVDGGSRSVGNSYKREEEYRFPPLQNPIVCS
jgi:hypothetical protein